MKTVFNNKQMRRDFIRNQSLISAQQRLINAERIEWKDAMNFDLRFFASMKTTNIMMKIS